MIERKWLKVAFPSVLKKTDKHVSLLAKSTSKDFPVSHPTRGLNRIVIKSYDLTFHPAVNEPLWWKENRVSSLVAKDKWCNKEVVLKKRSRLNLSMFPWLPTFFNRTDKIASRLMCIAIHKLCGIFSNSLT